MRDDLREEAIRMLMIFGAVGCGVVSVGVVMISPMAGWSIMFMGWILWGILIARIWSR